MVMKFRQHTENSDNVVSIATDAKQKIWPLVLLNMVTKNL